MLPLCIRSRSWRRCFERPGLRVLDVHGESHVATNERLASGWLCCLAMIPGCSSRPSRGDRMVSRAAGTCRLWRFPPVHCMSVDRPCCATRRRIGNSACVGESQRSSGRQHESSSLGRGRLRCCCRCMNRSQRRHRTSSGRALLTESHELMASWGATRAAGARRNKR